MGLSWGPSARPRVTKSNAFLSQLPQATDVPTPTAPHHTTTKKHTPTPRPRQTHKPTPTPKHKKENNGHDQNGQN